MPYACEPLSDEQLEQLDTYLLSAKVKEEALDYIALHGYLCALNISPEPMSENTWMTHVLAENPQSNASHLEPEMLDLMRIENNYIRSCLESDSGIELPCDLTLELDEEGDCLLEYWAQGFMEVVFSQEEAWFSQHETAVAESLLPFMLAANLDADQELAELRNQPNLCQQLCEQIPELVQDLFLLFRVPVDKPKGPANQNFSSKKGHKPRRH
ncbi:MAG: YecA family protein [Gammaproteobacteria bacterium]|jgi:uncharacterized protein|nr:YecA family protein [Gammaproteobacteria bacterium]